MVVDGGRGVVVLMVTSSPRQVTATSSFFLVQSVFSQKPFLQSAMVGSDPSQSKSDNMWFVRFVASRNKVCSLITVLASPLDIKIRKANLYSRHVLKKIRSYKSTKQKV